MALRALQGPLAVAEGCIFVRIIRTLDDVPAAGHVKLAISRAVYFVREITAIILFVTLEGRVHALPVRTVERTWAKISSISSNFTWFRGTIYLRTSRASVGTAHEREQGFARGQLPRLPVVRQRDVHAFTWLRIRLPRRPETWIPEKNVQTVGLKLTWERCSFFSEFRFFKIYIYIEKYSFSLEMKFSKHVVVEFLNHRSEIDRLREF